MLIDNNSNKVNYIFNTCYQILTVVMPLITAPYVSRVLGADGVGQYSYTFSLVTYFVLIATLGTTTYGQREIAYNKDSINNRSIVFWNTFIFRIITSLIMCFAFFAFISMVKTKNSLSLLYIQFLYIINVGLDVSWFFQGIAEFVTITVRNTFVKLLGVILIFAFVRTSNDVAIYCFILAFCNTAGFLITLPMLRGRIEKVSIKEINLKEVLKGCFPLFIPTVAVQIYTVVDKTMIGMFTISNVENGYYDQAEKIVKMTVVLVTSLSTVLAPKIATAYVQGKRCEVMRYMKTLFRYVCIIGFPIVCGLFCISDYFIPFFLGPGYEKCILLMKVFSPIVFFLGMSNATGSTYLVQTSQQTMVNISVIVGATVNVILNSILIPRYLSIGAAVASIIAECTVMVIQLVAVNRDISIINLFSGDQLYLIASLVMAIVVYIAGRIFFFIWHKKFYHCFIANMHWIDCLRWHACIKKRRYVNENYFFCFKENQKEINSI